MSSKVRTTRFTSTKAEISQQIIQYDSNTRIKDIQKMKDVKPIIDLAALWDEVEKMIEELRAIEGPAEDLGEYETVREERKSNQTGNV